MKKWLIATMACSGILLASCSNSPEVASTENGRIREDALYDRMKNEVTQSGQKYGEQMLQQMLLEDILENAHGDQVSEEDVDAEFESEAEQYGGVDQFEELIANQGLEVDELKKTMRTSLLVEKAITEYADFSDEDIQEAYDNYAVNNTVAHILVEDEETANDIIGQLNDGADFAELVQEFSTDTASVANNGEMELVEGQFVPEFEEAANALENEGDITQEPVQSEFGYHIIKLVSVGEKGSLEEEKATIQENMIAEKLADQAYVQEVISSLVADANVQIADEDLSNAMSAYMEPAMGEEQPVEEEIPADDTTDMEENTEENSDENTDTEADTETDTEENTEDSE
ncbi:peptidylprolyl isomerase [Marinilactibacillus sp. XAAS-LB27]|uniref:peptidylprolyl isomerase n=1 Tax=Marinilactibacillus sp. XAAS-LB27 TaxID=3114538 RepID=UPI002E19B5F2|nr:peptidylprolyl isomerase [Marinilactibacillus sp. XAAS-LB27]